MQDADLRLTWKDRLNVLSLSDRVETLLRYHTQDFSSIVSLEQLIHPADMNPLRALFSATASSRHGETSMRIRSSDGRIRCLHARYQRDRAPEGDCVLAMRLAELPDLQEIRERGGDLLAVLESVDQCACIKDRHHVVREANRGFRALFSQSNPIESTDYDLFPEDYADRSYEAEERIFAGEPVVRFAVQASDHAGAKRSFENRSMSVRDERGKVVGVCSVVVDTTAWLLAERAIRLTEQSLKEAERIAGLGSFQIDVRSRTWTGSDTLYEILGLDGDGERTVAVWSELIPTEDYARLSTLYGEMVEGKNLSLDAETRFLHSKKREKPRWARIRCALERDPQGRPQTLRGTIEDITERKLADAQIDESAKLLELFIHDAPTGLAMFDREMRFMSASRRWIEDREQAGWDVVGQCLYDLHPDIPDGWREDHRRALAGETVPTKEERYRREDGTDRWVRRMVRPWWSAEGAVGGIVVLSEDITARREAERAVQESREQLQLFIERAPAAIAMFDREMRYLAVSRRWLESFELGDSSILGRRHYDVFPDLPDHWKRAHQRGFAGEGARMEEELFVRADGTKHWVRWELLPWRNSDGTVGGIVLFTENINLLKENEDRLQLAASVFTHTSEAILITDAEGVILEVNDAFTRIYGYVREEVLGKNPRLLNSGRQPYEFYAEMWAQLRERGQWSGEIWNRSKTGQILPGTLTISAIPDAAGRTTQYVGLFSDLSSIKEKEKQLRDIAHFDVLTGLPNRTLFVDRLRQAIAQSKQMGCLLAVAYLDLDDFTAFNERHGRLVGDHLLTRLTQQMSAVLRQGDTLARLCFDEFAVILQDITNIEECLTLIGRLRDAVAYPMQLDEITLRTTASIGVTLYPQAEEVEPGQLIRQADQAMYFAKLAGKSRYHIFDPMLDRNMRGRHEDLRRIRQALHAEEFELYFQPKVNMRTGEVLGAEALIRWRHPELGLLLPQHFLPVMQGNLLVIELGEWVIASALSHLDQWRALGLNIPVSVNVDAMQLQEPRFVDRLKEALARHPQVGPSKLQLEVLESSSLQDLAQVSEVIRACGKLGVSFALDDFGTGYSSLAYLKRLPVDVLKIDQSFVHDMLDDPEDLSILEGVLLLASAFRRQAIAEGVETVDHGLMLLRLGCQVGQGYQIARPMRASDLPQWAAAWRPDPRWVETSSVDPVKWPALRAGVDHRAWLVELEEYVEGRRLVAPAMNPRECRFGQWLEGEAAAGRGQHPEFRSVYDLHRDFHSHADDILDRKAQNGGPMAWDLSGLRTLRDNLLEKLHHLQQTL